MKAQDLHPPFEPFLQFFNVVKKVFYLFRYIFAPFLVMLDILPERRHIAVELDETLRKVPCVLLLVCRNLEGIDNETRFEHNSSIREASHFTKHCDLSLLDLDRVALFLDHIKETLCEVQSDSPCIPSNVARFPHEFDVRLWIIMNINEY